MTHINERCMEDKEYRKNRQELWNKLFSSRTLHTAFQHVVTVSSAASLIATIDRDSFEEIVPKEHAYIAAVTLGNIDRYAGVKTANLGTNMTGKFMPKAKLKEQNSKLEDTQLEELKSAFSFLNLNLSITYQKESVPVLSCSNKAIDPIKLKEEKDDLIASSIRAAGKLSTFPAFQDDFQFLSDLADAIILAYPLDRNPTSASFKIRSNTALATANLTSCFFKNIDRLGQEMKMHLDPNRVFCNLIKLSTKTCRDKNDKVVPNGLRALGNLTYIFWELYPERAEFPNQEDSKLFKSVYDLLDSALSDTDDNKLTKSKIRWNAASAIKDIMNSSNFIHQKNQFLVDKFLKASITAFLKSNIHKVKSFCADAIFKIKGWDLRKIEIFGQFVLLSYNRDVMHINRNLDADKQIGVKRVVIKLFLHFLKILAFQPESQGSELESEQTGEFSFVENSKFDFQKFLKSSAASKKVRINPNKLTTFESELPITGTEDVDQLEIEIYHQKYNIQDKLENILSEIYQSIKFYATEDIQPAEYASAEEFSQAVSSSAYNQPKWLNEYNSRVWFKNLMMENLEFVTEMFQKNFPAIRI